MNKRINQQIEMKKATVKTVAHLNRLVITCQGLTQSVSLYEQ